MLNLDTAIVMIMVLVIGYICGIYTEKKYGKRNNNIISKRR